jgi:selenocysteine-specific elongation factor
MPELKRLSPPLRSNMRVIGTAGHVDHGKSTLIEALTGVHPDRLKEEREREMTIDLGFAWMTLPAIGTGQPEEVGIVDVPGHRDFIENMLAGIGGIDAALFVVAADEGVMPQTREHLSILDILQIQGGVVALTKIDMVNDPDWLDLVEADLQEVLAHTVLADAAIIRLSARTGAGIPELKRQLSQLLSQRPARPDLNRPRLPVDRVFTIAGFGSVVTGTLVDGSLRVGDEIEILPQGLRSRVRGLQTHRQKEQVAVPGSRTAVNISGISLEQIQRGNVLTHPGDYRPTQRIDVHFRLLADASQALKHNTETKLFIGAAEVVARLRLLGAEELAPGEEGWLQLELHQPVVAIRGDRYLLRRPSPGETLGGGMVVDPHPKGRHKRFTADTLASLEALSAGSPSDILLQALLALGAASLKDVYSRSNLGSQVAAHALQELVTSGQIINLEDRPAGAGAYAASSESVPDTASTMASAFALEDLVLSLGYWEQLARRILLEVESYHRSYPLRRGLPREELKSRLKELTHSSPRLFNAAIHRLELQGRLKESGPLVFLPEHAIRFTSEQQAKIDRLLARFAASHYSPPGFKECQAEVGEDVLAALVETGQLVAVAPDVLFRRVDFDHMVADVRSIIQQRGSITVAEARDHFNTSRRYVLAFLEYLDATGVTIRLGDDRRLKS